jgi:hypothetical protein
MSWGYRSKNKFGAKRVTYDNHSFASKLEHAVYLLLKCREQTGEIEIIQCQAQVRLTKAEILYIPDFKCLDLKTKEVFYCEAKGMVQDRFALIKKLWKHYSKHKLEIWSGSHTRPFLKEIIVPVESDNIDETTKNDHK